MGMAYEDIAHATALTVGEVKAYVSEEPVNYEDYEENTVADVVRNLSFKQKEKGLSTGEKKMLTNAKQILVSELVLAEHSNKDEMEEMVDNKINNSFITFRAADTVKESVVSKFIPFDGGSTSENT